MNGFGAFLHKELLENWRSGRVVLLGLVFVLLGVLNPAMAKLTPWLMELMSETLAESGLTVSAVEVDALTAWPQFFKNLPMALLVFVLVQSGVFTREYESGTLVLMLTRGVKRRQVLGAKALSLLTLWSAGYWLCFWVTWGYNAWFWDNSVACHLFATSGLWWLFGVWVTAVLVLCSTLARHSSGVLLGALGAVLGAWVLTLFPVTADWSPARLMDGMALLTGSAQVGNYARACVVTAVTALAALGISVPVLEGQAL